MGLTRRGWRTDRLAAAKLYLCTDARRAKGDLLGFADSALAGGTDIVQLREKPTAEGPIEALTELALLAQIKELTGERKGLLAVNDRADVAIAARADVLHLGQRDLPVAVARGIVGPDMLIGRSTHALAQAEAAIEDPEVDYFCVGPCWSTPTKPGRAAVGLELVAQVAALSPDKPWFAIGGIDLERLAQVTAAGATRVVVVRAITEAADPRAAAEALVAGLR